MSFDLTDLHTLIVRAHHRHDVPIGKMMRVALQAAANRKFPLYKSDGSRLELKKGGANRNWLLRHAAIAEQQTEVLWWEEKPWSALRAFLSGSFGNGLMVSSPRVNKTKLEAHHRTSAMPLSN